ncbi:MAG TPA: glycosyltransferase [Candidatus Cybelea sp.]|jgi:glycosyltransferase involved in cell wall biosynthesis|nr:glycosyltransferase [Candidatus Cybelea sp.]
MEISVIIATKDRASYLERALESLSAQRGAPAFEAIVVDNGSSDATAAVTRAYAGGSAPVRYLYAPEPNRGKARNRGVEIARGRYLLFCDDDVQLPVAWICAHAAAHGQRSHLVVNGPILNVPSYESRPKPRAANYSRAFLCTCNASLAKDAFLAAGGFDENFDLYGWEDTELGVRLRSAGLQWKFAWEAYLWHVKPPEENTLAVESRKAIEKARMARRFLAKHPSRRARLATGAHAINLLRARHLLPDRLLPFYAGLATSTRLPDWMRALARAQLLDALYSRELVRTLDSDNGG